MSEELLSLQQRCGGVIDANLVNEEQRIAHFGNPEREYQAATTASALFDVSNRNQLELTGDDCQKFLHNFCTNDIKALRPGTGCEAFVTNIKGRILGHVFVFADADSLWVESVPGSEEPLFTHLDRYIITEDVEIHRRSSEWGELFVSGPRASDAVSQLASRTIDLHSNAHLSVHDADTGENVIIRRVDWFNMPGFLISAPRHALPEIWTKLNNAENVDPAGDAVFETLRIEAGFPWYGIDITEDNLAQEASRTECAISFKKGCYLGQEPIARLDALGHVNRQLCSLRIEAAHPPGADTAIVADEDGKEAGRVTSSAPSCSDGKSVAMAIVKSAFATPGTTVVVDTPEGNHQATVFWNA